MMRKIGSKVTVRGDLVHGRVYGDMVFIGSMKHCLGRTATIESYGMVDGHYRLKNMGAYMFTEAMFKQDDWDS